MTFPGRTPKRANSAITPTPGEIWEFRTAFAPYPKFHLRVSFDGHFLFLNSPKPGRNLGNYALPEASVRRLPRNAEGISVVSCTRVISQPDDVVLKPEDARGALLPDEMLDIAIHIDMHELIERRLSRPWLPDLFTWAEAMRGR